jgi:hypothetical protein
MSTSRWFCNNLLQTGTRISYFPSLRIAQSLVVVQQQTVIKVGLLYNWLANKTTVKEHFVFMFNNEILVDVHFKVILLSCCGIILLRIRIRDPVPFWPRNLGWVKKSRSGSGMNISDHIFDSLETIFWAKNT